MGPRLALAFSLLTAPALFAQVVQPSTRPADDMLHPDGDKRPPLQAITVVTPVNKATVNPIDPRFRPATLKREGSFVFERTGTITRSPDGRDALFNFDPDPTGANVVEPPMVLQPNLALSLAENQIKAGGRSLRFRVSGQVQEYLGRNYLLLQKVVVVNDASDAVPPPPSTAPASMPVDTATQPATPNDVLDAMLQTGEDKRPPMAAAEGDSPVNDATTRPVDPKAVAGVLRREGGSVINRTGRVSRSPDGRTFELHFVADNGRSQQDPPMVLLPNLSLMLIQDQLRLGGRDAKFRVSGTVTEYHGRNCLLLSKFMPVND